MAGRKPFDPSTAANRGWDYPRRENGRIDKKAVETEYMASDHLSWADFCRMKNWPFVQTYQQLPIKEWVETKKKAFAREQGDELGGAVFKHRFQYQKDVLAALKKYPKEHERIMTAITRVHYIWETQIAHDMALEKKLGRPLTKKEMTYKPTPAEISSMANALSKVTESKYKSLLMNDWSAKMSDEFKPEEAEEKALAENQPFSITLIGGKKPSNAQILELWNQYLDKPAPEQPAIDVAAVPSEGDPTDETGG